MSQATATSDPQTSQALQPPVAGSQPRLAVALLALTLCVPWFLTDDPLSALIPVMGAAGAVIGLYLGISRPAIVCALFIAFSYFRIHEALPFLVPLKIPQLLGMLAGFSLAYHFLISGRIKAQWTPELKLFALFFVMVTVGAPIAVVPSVAFEYWTSIYVKIAMMTFAMAWLVRSDKEFKAVGSIIMVSGLIVACVAIYNSIQGIDLVGDARVTIGLKLKSAIGDPNDLALVLLLPLAFALSQIIHRTSRLNTLFAVLVAVLVIIAIVATKSRGGLIGVAFTTLAIGHTIVRHKMRLWVGCLALGAMLYGAMGISERDDMGGQVGALDESSNSRLHTWSAATRMAIKRPVTGVGLDNFVPSYNEYRHELDNRDHAVHSTWFAVLAETGFPGFAVFVAMIWASYRTNRETRHALKKTSNDPVLNAAALALFAGLVGFCAAGTFLTQAFTWPLYVIMGLTAALALVSANRFDTGLVNSDAAPAARPVRGRSRV